MEGTKNGRLASSKQVAGDQGRGGVGASGDGKKCIDLIDLRDNQGVKSTGHSDRFNVGMRESEGVMAEYQICLSSNWMLVGYTGRGPDGAQKS